MHDDSYISWELDVCPKSETRKETKLKKQKAKNEVSWCWWTVAVGVGGDMLEEYILITNNNIILLHNV